MENDKMKAVKFLIFGFIGASLAIIFMGLLFLLIGFDFNQREQMRIISQSIALPMVLSFWYLGKWSIRRTFDLSNLFTSLFKPFTEKRKIGSLNRQKIVWITFIGFVFITIWIQLNKIDIKNEYFVADERYKAAWVEKNMGIQYEDWEKKGFALYDKQKGEFVSLSMGKFFINNFLSIFLYQLILAITISWILVVMLFESIPKLLFFVKNWLTS
jgi:hypothetical protein